MKKDRNHTKRLALAKAMWDVTAARVALLNPLLTRWEYTQRLARLCCAVAHYNTIRHTDTRTLRPDGRIDPRRVRRYAPAQGPARVPGHTLTIRVTGAPGFSASEVRALLAKIQNEVGGA